MQDSSRCNMRDMKDSGKSQACPDVSLIYKPHCLNLVTQGSHKNLKSEFHDFSMTDLLLSMTPLLTWFSDIVMIVFHDMHDNHKLESCYSHENKQFHDFSLTFWEIFTFQDFSMTFPWQQFFPGFSMTVGTLSLYSCIVIFAFISKNRNLQFSECVAHARK